MFVYGPFKIILTRRLFQRVEACLEDGDFSLHPHSFYIPFIYLPPGNISSNSKKKVVLNSFTFTTSQLGRGVTFGIFSCHVA